MSEETGAQPRTDGRDALIWFMRLVEWDLALLQGVPSGGERRTKAPDPGRRESALRAEVRRGPRF